MLDDILRCSRSVQQTQTQGSVQLRPRSLSDFHKAKAAVIFERHAGAVRDTVLPAALKRGSEKPCRHESDDRRVGNHRDIPAAFVKTFHERLLKAAKRRPRLLRAGYRNAHIHAAPLVQLRKALLYLAEAQTVPQSHIRLTKSRYNYSRGRKIRRRLARSRKRACKYRAYPGVLKLPRRKTGLHMPYRAERNIRPPEAAAPVREIRPSVPDKIHAPAHSSSPKQS